jgi:6-phosphogluconolactonase
VSCEKINCQIFVKESAEELAAECAGYVLDTLSEALKSRGRATIAVSGGSTPKALFAKMAKADFDWSRVHVFWVDERCVPPTDNQSNYKLAREALLAPARIPDTNVHRILGELPPEEAAKRYVEEIKQFFQLREGELPVFDLIHRGIGADAHTASLFPGEPLIADRKGIAAHVWVEKMKSHRVTLLPGVLLAARQTVIEAVGEDKAGPVHSVLEGPVDLFRFPCQIAARDHVAWFLDHAAASKL